MCCWWIHLILCYFYSELLIYTLLQGVIRKYDDKDNSQLDVTSSSKARFPFQLKITRVINKVKALFGISYTNLSEDLLPSHTINESSTNSVVGNSCNTTKAKDQVKIASPVPSGNKYNYQRHQMRRQSNLPREIQTQLQKASESQV